MINPLDVFDRDDVGQTTSNNDYLKCVYGDELIEVVVNRPGAA